MNITLNGTEHARPRREPPSAPSSARSPAGRWPPNGQSATAGRLGVAVARNAEVVPRSQWHGTALADGDDIELVTAVQGG